MKRPLPERLLQPEASQRPAQPEAWRQSQAPEAARQSELPAVAAEQCAAEPASTGLDLPHQRLASLMLLQPELSHSEYRGRDRQDEPWQGLRCFR